MKFKVGDKVKFLNESGGGVVSKIVSPSMVNVAIEDGFEIPVLSSELIKMELEAPVDSPKHMFREDYDIQIEAKPETQYEENSRNVPLLNNYSKGSLAQGIYFAFVPHDQKWLITGLLDVYLVNYTPYEILYSLFLEKEEGGFSGFDYGSVISNSMVLLETLDREEMGKWEKGVVQVLFHHDSANKVLAPGNSAFRIKATRFYQEGNYKDSAIISGKSILISLLPLTAQTSIFQIESATKDIVEEHIITESKEVEPEHVIDKHRTSPREAVVDLHIYELVKDYENLENAEMLRIQVNYFTRCLESAIANKLSKVTFIHGVGTGVLKTAIKQILKDYPHIEIRDASLQQFGYGATEVLIKG
ncbi:MAG: DUF2027 domain-containing protein [Bacteroidales bacterium]|nr:DUF2027 domain-containing protein [Bacteroidales bacterium]